MLLDLRHMISMFCCLDVIVVYLKTLADVINRVYTNYLRGITKVYYFLGVSLKWGFYLMFWKTRLLVKSNIPHVQHALKYTQSQNSMVLRMTVMQLQHICRLNFFPGNQLLRNQNITLLEVWRSSDQLTRCSWYFFMCHHNAKIPCILFAQDVRHTFITQDQFHCMHCFLQMWHAPLLCMPKGRPSLEARGIWRCLRALSLCLHHSPQQPRDTICPRGREVEGGEGGEQTKQVRQHLLRVRGSFQSTGNRILKF